MSDTTYTCESCGERDGGGYCCACTCGDDCTGLIPHTVTCDRCGDLHASDDSCGCRPCENCGRYPGDGGCDCRCCDRCGEFNGLCGCFDDCAPPSKVEPTEDEQREMCERHAASLLTHPPCDDLPF